MANKKRLIIEYSKNALTNALEIVSYLQRKFTEKEINKFYQSLDNFEQIIGSYPNLYPKSSSRNIRRAVLSKELSIFYIVRKKTIYVVAIFDNRWGQDKIIK